MIPVGKKGRIVQGDRTGWFILVQEDSASTGGYYILKSEDADFKGKGFDDWVQNKDSLEKYFLKTNLQIEWLE